MTLQEIDNRLSLLHEYLKYRIYYNAKFGVYATWQRFENTDIRFIGCHAYSFDNWLTKWHKIHEDNTFTYFQNKLGYTFAGMKLEGSW